MFPKEKIRKKLVIYKSIFHFAFLQRLQIPLVLYAERLEIKNITRTF